MIVGDFDVPPHASRRAQRRASIDYVEAGVAGDAAAVPQLRLPVIQLVDACGCSDAIVRLDDAAAVRLDPP